MSAKVHMRSTKEIILKPTFGCLSHTLISNHDITNLGPTSLNLGPTIKTDLWVLVTYTDI